jgi:transmembrane sensor
MLNQQEKDIIKRYLNGQTSDLEAIWVEELFAGAAENQELHKLLQEEWSITDAEKEIRLDHLLDKIHHIIRLKEIEKQRSASRRFIQIYSRIAAVLLIPILLAGLWYYFTTAPITGNQIELPVKSTIYAPLGSRVAFNLPDGSTGYLNSGSSLTYSMPFAENRSVVLQGEAWFDVAHDENHPFEIGALTSAVKVLGTSFNICAYEDQDFIEVVLAEGSIEFLANATSPAVHLKPDERLVFNGEKINIEKTDPAKYQGWTEGKLIFRGDNMAEVARRLERWYNIEVEVADTDLNDYIFRATFEDDSLMEVLKLLSMTSPIRFTISPRQRMADDTWKKEKITLYKRS